MAKHKTQSPSEIETPPPMIRMDLEDIEGAGEADIGDNLVLEVRGTVMELSKMRYGEEDDHMTSVVIKINSAKLTDRDIKKKAKEEPSLGSIAEA